MIDFPGFYKILGKSWAIHAVSKMAHLLANRGWELANFLGKKIRGRWKYSSDAGNGEDLAAIRVQNRASPDGDRLSRIFPQFLGKSWGTSVSPKWPLFT